jgi:carbon-monoxide dehydrogenase small subunit
VRADETLLETLRSRLGLLGTKENCLKGECGVCTVLLDDTNVYSCLVLTAMAEGHAITTVEGLAADDLKHAFLRHGAVQCGYCTPGMLISAQALLEHSSNPTEADVRQGLAGNLCRCTGYARIVDAVLDVAAARAAGNAAGTSGTEA